MDREQIIHELTLKYMDYALEKYQNSHVDMGKVPRNMDAEGFAQWYKVTKNQIDRVIKDQNAR